MRKLLLVLLPLCFAFPLVTTTAFASEHAKAFEQDERRVMNVPGARRRRRLRGDRRRRRGIRHAFKQAGLSAGRGGKRLGQNMARGRVARGGKEFGKGMGGFGKHTGKGFGRIGKRIGQTTKRALTP
ncbi:MAG TPA: hypothetical protein VGB17_03120 [Pyrinomonadaceae bacterium]|jgi:hypothetical protein